MTKNNGLSYKLDFNSKALNCRCLRSKAYASSEVLVEHMPQVKYLWNITY